MIPPPAPPSGAVVDWLLAGDPSVRWQVLRDLLDASPSEVSTERARVADEGWGAALLGRQDPDGLWAGALYSPKWTSTTYTLLLLHRLGLPSSSEQARRGCERLWAAAKEYDGGGLNLAKTVKEPETCITAMLVLLGRAYGGVEEERLDNTVAWLLDQQLDDGGWNCETVRSGSSHGSFHSTISVLEALRDCEGAREPRRTEVVRSRLGGEEFLLRHRLFRSHRTGQVVDEAFLRFPFPPQWHYDVLRGLEHFRVTSGPRDARADEAVEVVRAARRADGRWPRHRPHPGRSWFALEAAGPSRWATLRCLRVLCWWATPVEGRQAPP